MNRMIRVWRRMSIFANPGMLFQTDTSYFSRLVISHHHEEFRPTLQADLERDLSYGQVVSHERGDWILAPTRVCVKKNLESRQIIFGPATRKRRSVPDQ